MHAPLDYPHIECPPDGPARLRRLPRVRVAQVVMDYLAHGWSAEEMCRQHPNLTPAEAHSAMAYYFDHQETIDAEIAAEMREFETMKASGHRSPFVTRMKTKGML